MAKEPTTMKSAMRMALMEDKAAAISKSSRKHTSNKGWIKNVEKTPVQASAVQKDVNHDSHSSQKTTKKLSSQEYKEKRENGLCYFCDEKYVAGHKYKNQKVYRIEVSTESDEESVCGSAPLQEESSDEEVVFDCQCYGMEGTLGVSAIRLVGKIHGTEVGFMVDTGTTHNFIDPITVARLQLKVAELTPFIVTVAGGEMFKGKEYCPEVAISLPGLETKVDLLIIPLGDSQVLLGTIWLQSLGPILWDFSKIWQRKNLFYCRESHQEILK